MSTSLKNNSLKPRQAVSLSVDIEPVLSFLHCETPAAWLTLAINNIPTLLVDHANCEKKAASTALTLLYRYTDCDKLLNKLSRLAREELRHFEQVLAIMRKRNVYYEHISPSRYAAMLRQSLSNHEPNKLIDTLIVGAYIEARSCERFAKIAPLLAQAGETELANFYTSLLRSEARHFQDYLDLAQTYASDDIAERVTFFGEKEAECILLEDNDFRFHSGIPANI